MKNRDRLCLRALTSGPGAAIHWILMASYGYYHLDESLLSDTLYDQLFQIVEKNREALADHPHLKFITPESCAAGSLFDLKVDEYPSMAKDACEHLIKVHLK